MVLPFVVRSVQIVPLVVAVALTATIGCARDRYETRTDAIKTHVKNFYGHLEADRVGAAITENQRIEAIANEAGGEVLRRAQPAADNRIDRDWMLVRTANEAAAENWLALARYFLIKKRYDEARGAYRRVLDEFSDAGYHTYTEQARQGLKDLDVLAPTH